MSHDSFEIEMTEQEQVWTRTRQVTLIISLDVTASDSRSGVRDRPGVAVTSSISHDDSPSLMGLKINRIDL